MADIKKGANEPFLYDDQTDRITGVKNSDSSEKKFVYTDGSSGPVVITGGATITPNANAPTSNVVLGPSAGAAMVSTNNNNICIGSGAGDGLAGSANSSIAIGTDALGATITASVANTAVGRLACALNQGGNQNTAVGYEALRLNVNGNTNTAIGDNCLRACLGSGNVGLGQSTALALGTADDNTFIGRVAALNQTSGNNNTYLGNAAGRFRGSSTDTLLSATSTVLIGHQSRANDNAQTNQVVIAGVDGLGDGSNTTVIGNTSTTSTRIAGTATSRFFIDGDTMRITGTRTPASNAAGTAGDFAFGTDGGTTYLYYCIASGNWGRVALTTGY